MTAKSRLRTLGIIVLSPGILVHEAIHAFIGGVWTSDMQINRYPRPHVDMVFPAGTPIRGMILAMLGPTIVGVALFPIYAVAVGAPTNAIKSIIFIWYLILLIPSRDDVFGVVEILDSSN